MRKQLEVTDLFDIWFNELNQSAIGISKNPNFATNYYLLLPDKMSIINEWKQSDKIASEILSKKIEDLKQTTIEYIIDYENEIKELKEKIENLKNNLL